MACVCIVITILSAYGLIHIEESTKQTSHILKHEVWKFQLFYYREKTISTQSVYKENVSN